jgi:hypothetical protein
VVYEVDKEVILAALLDVMKNCHDWCRAIECSPPLHNTWENTGLLQKYKNDRKAINNVSMGAEYRTVFLPCTLMLTSVSCLPIQVRHLQRWYMAYNAYHCMALCLNFPGCHLVRRLCLWCASVWFHTSEPNWRTEWLGASCWGHQGVGCRCCCDSIQPSTFCGKQSCWEIMSTTWVGMLQVIHHFFVWLVWHWSMQLSGNGILGLYLDYNTGSRKTVYYLMQLGMLLYV